jgi:predicted DNA-binding transcriptional regulator YafY
MSQRQQLERVLEIDRRIRAGLYPHPDRLALEWEVSRRVLFKDRDFLIGNLGAPLVFDKTRRGWAYSDKTWGLPSTLLTEGELLALVLGMECAQRYAGTALETSLRSAVAKITRSLRGPVTVNLDAIRQGFSVSPPAAQGAAEETLTALLTAIRERRLVKMRYYAAYKRQEAEREVQPVHLVNREGDWYLVAYDRSRSGYRYFHAGRIRRLKVLSRALRPRPQAEVDAWMAQSFQILTGESEVDVAVRFDAEQAPYVRDRLWHTSQRIEERPDGGLVLRLKTAGLIGIRRWVLQYGPHAEVLQPKSLRDEVRREAEDTGRLYAKPPVRRKKRS